VGPSRTLARRRKTRPTKAHRSAAELNWAFHASDGAILDALAKGRHRGSLREQFGSAAYRELSVLAARAQKVKNAGGPRVLILPGIMGSRLCALKRSRGASAAAPASASQEVLWIDPERIATGRLKELILPSAESIRPMGVLLFYYARMKLMLEIEGFDAGFFPYDWRLGIDELGTALASRIAAQDKPVILIAHSMGGMIARIAAKRLPRRLVRKLIMLGTPNRGSFSPVLALRGTYPFVRKMARLDHRHSPEYLAQEVFCTFPGIYHMLPPARRRGAVDLLDPRAWPRTGAVPDPALLGRVAAVRRQLAAPDSRMYHIVGINRETVVAVRRTPAGFEYGSSLNGDGSVPVASALLPKLKTYFIDESHGNLANNSRVIRAVIDLARRGSTRELPRHYVPSHGRLSRVDDARLRLIGGGKIDWRRLSSAQRKAVLAELDGAPLA
jgi:pimeloyl-ACP methyl ester carboxylesterase